VNAQVGEPTNRWVCSSDSDSGESGRPARSVWRLAKHMPASAFIDSDQAPSQPSEEKLIEGCQPGSGTRDAPRSDRDGRAPRNLRFCARTSRCFRFGLALGLALCLRALTTAAAAADDPAGLEFFESKIRPILVDNCYHCHSHQSEKVKGGLLLDTREGLLKGGDTGPAIKPGDLEQSLLIKAVRYTDHDLQMPPKNKKLPADQIAALEAWVKMGAPDPRVAAAGVAAVQTIREKARSHWAFQPVRQPKVPDVKHKGWVRTPVDNFILAPLEAAHLLPSPQADKHTLIRRATFDLIGLPPTPEEVAAFEADKTPAAFAKVVDRLLASPRYGERWGRHWLDVARYADTKGYVFEEDRHYAYAYTYRDYVIRSFNQDLPYDQFIKEQIAADLLPGAADKPALAALGYLTLGRRFVNNINDIIDDRIDVVCRGMMGLTVGCARCHDHKFDPIPSRDYYSLYGVFASSMEPEQEPLLAMEVPAKAREEYLAEHKKRVEERAKFKAEKERAMEAQLRSQAGDYLLAAYEAQRAGDKPDAEGAAHNHKLDADVLRRWMAGLEGWHTNQPAIFAPWFAFAALATNEFPARAKELAAQFSTNQNEAADATPAINPLVARGFAGDPPGAMKDVAERYGKVFAEIDKRWQEALTNAPAPRALPDAAEEALRQILYAADAPANVPHSEFDRLYDVPAGQKLRELQRHIEELDASSPGAPPRAMALVDRSDPHDTHVFIRGNSDNQGPEAPREFLEILSGPDRKPFQHGSGRLELAQAIASRDNPLTARVLVNRVWLHHFGSGLVATASDFGLRSEPPTHPELLDYLASRFMDEGWSIKNLHRLIMLSSAYQQSSENTPAFAKVDPNNQLLWRMNRQRLEFEPMRDTLLAVSGKLDLTPGGHAVDIIDPASDRRTVYGYVDRQNLPDLFRTFDFASPDASSPRRFYTTVPQQALFLMNSPFVINQAKHLVERPDFKSASTDQQRLHLIYQWAYQRDPSREEIEWARQLLQTPTAAFVVPGATNWVLGYGAFDEASSRVQAFQTLPFFTGRAFQGGAALPDPKLGWVILNDTGGHPGNDQQHAAIRRWIAPRDGTITISGALAHPESKGDGVRGRIVSSQLGLLGQWLAHNNKQDTHLEHVKVRQGDTIDFVTDCNGSVDFDGFTWSPTIHYLAEGKTAPGARIEWSAASDFTDAARATHPSLDAWQKYAQVILMSNELVFVD